MSAQIKFIVILILVAFIACKKNSTSTNECFPNDAFSREITNEKATVIKLDSEFYLTEQGAIDTKLRPCTLPSAFQVDGLAVIISGEVKEGEFDSRICCTENFVITNITKQ